MRPGVPIRKDLVLVGGGHSHVTVLRRFGMKPLPGVRLTLISREVDTPYSGMLPGLVAGHYSFDDCHIDLVPLARFAGARFFQDEVTGIDPERKLVHCAARPPVSYDLLSINSGSSPSMQGVPGARDNVIPVKPIGRFLGKWETLVERVVGSTGRYRVGVVGTGAGGVELLLAAEHRLRGLLERAGDDPRRLEFVLVGDSLAPLPHHPERVRQRFGRILRARGIELRTEFRVVEVRPGWLRAESGQEVVLDEILWVTSAGSPPWIAQSSIDTDPGGFLAVDATLRSMSHPEIFAAGDVAAVVPYPREKAGVFAVRQGPVLDRNLRRVLCGEDPVAYRPQSRFLTIISTGDRYAVASRGRLSAEGRWVWRWKDRIDRKFMARYRDLPEMEVNAESEAPHAHASMRCTGCGGKVGADVLSRALRRAGVSRRDDVLVGLESPDDAAVVVPPPGMLVVQSVDFFRAIVDDPWELGQIACEHALGDLYAMGAVPWTALAVVTLPFELEAKSEETLADILRGAVRTLDSAGAVLVGGHTSEGAELGLGFAVSGLVPKEDVIRKIDLEPGDALILTKPLGIGTLFAAEMRLRAKGRWIRGAIDSMLRSNKEAALSLRRHGVHAMTDITGFGLLGHLAEMGRTTRALVRVDVGAVPVLDGALETATAGYLSSLHPANARVASDIDGSGAESGDPRLLLLFDPQTSGGLLAAVPRERAEAALEELRSLGYSRAAVIGEVLDRDREAGFAVRLEFDP